MIPDPRWSWCSRSPPGSTEPQVQLIPEQQLQLNRQVSISLAHTQRYLVLLSGTKCYNVCSPLCDRDSTEQTPAFHRWSTPLHPTWSLPSISLPRQGTLCQFLPLPFSSATKVDLSHFELWMKIEMPVLENIKCCFEEKGPNKPWSSYLASTWKFKSPATPDWLVGSLEATVRAVYVHAQGCLWTVIIAPESRNA